MRTRQEVGIVMVCLETLTDFIGAKGHGRQTGYVIFRAQHKKMQCSLLKIVYTFKMETGEQ